MLKQHRANRIVSCLVCWTCGGRMGPNHFTLKDGGAVCGLFEAKNPLNNLRKISPQEVKEPSEIIVCFSQNGTIAHALHMDCKTVLGPWIRFQSAETLENALPYLGATMSSSLIIVIRCGDVARAAVMFGYCRRNETC